MPRFLLKILIILLILLLGIIASIIHYSRLEPIPLEREKVLSNTGKMHSDLEKIQQRLNEQEVLLETIKDMLTEKDLGEAENNKLASLLPPGLEYLAPVIIEEAEKYNLDPLYIVSIIEKESSFDPNAIAHNPTSQDLGLMQINSGTLPYLARALGFPATKETALDPAKNIKMGCYYLGQHLETYDGDLYLVATRYNAGPRGANAGRNAYSLSIMEQYRHNQGVVLSTD